MSAGGWQRCKVGVGPAGPGGAAPHPALPPPGGQQDASPGAVSAGTPSARRRKRNQTPQAAGGEVPHKSPK